MKTRVPWFTVTVAAAAIAVHLLPSTAAWLQYDRAALGRGELWRIFTAHLTHFGANHLLWDLGVLLTFGAVCEGRSRAQCATALGVAAVAISAALWLWQPQFAIYRGLSGLDCALVGLLAGSLLRSGKVSRWVPARLRYSGSPRSAGVSWPRHRRSSRRAPATNRRPWLTSWDCSPASAPPSLPTDL